MRVLAIAATLVAAVGVTAPANAGPGQCYDAYGRPIGPVYDTDNPNYGFIQSVIRRGGSCTGVDPNYGQQRRYRGEGRYRDDRYYYNDPPRRRYRDYDD
jgi:hypothetical protein